MIAPLLALALAAGPACGLPSASPPPWRTGEALAFDLDLLGVVKAGVLSFAVERPMSAGRIVPLRARAKNTSTFANVKKLTAVALSWVDATTLLPERYREESEEDGLRRSTDARIPPGEKVVTLEQADRDQKGTRTYAREGAVLDAVSALYRLRASVLAPGDRFCFDLVATGRLWRFEGTIAPRTERIETPAGKFETMRIDATARRADKPEMKREVHLWMTTDARRLPVAAVSEIDLGPVRAVLSATRGTRR